MLDIGWQEILIIGVIALLVVGPNEMPKLLVRVSRFMRWVRTQVAQVQGGMDDIVKEAELDEIREAQKIIAAGGKAPGKIMDGIIAPLVDPRGDDEDDDDDLEDWQEEFEQDVRRSQQITPIEDEPHKVITPPAASDVGDPPPSARSDTSS